MVPGRKAPEWSRKQKAPTELRPRRQLFSVPALPRPHTRGEKALAAQRLQHLSERQTGLTAFLAKAEGQAKSLEESLRFTQQQLVDEEAALKDVTAQLETVRKDVDARRAIVDQNRNKLNGLRSAHQQAQRQQFDAEKKVAVADTSIQNLQRSQQHLEEEQRTRANGMQQLEKERETKSAQLQEKTRMLEGLQQQHQQTKTKILEACLSVQYMA